MTSKKRRSERKGQKMRLTTNFDALAEEDLYEVYDRYSEADRRKSVSRAVKKKKVVPVKKKRKEDAVNGI